MPVTVAQLREAKPELFGHASEQWASMSESLDGLASRYSKGVVSAIASYAGVDGLWARQRAQDGYLRVTGTSTYLQATAILLADAAIGVTRAKGILDDAVAEAARNHLVIDDTGVVRTDPGYVEPPLMPGAVPQTPLGVLANPAIASVANKVRIALSLATDVDDKVCAGLRMAQDFGPDDSGPWLQNVSKAAGYAARLLPDLMAKYGDDGKDPNLRPWSVKDAGLGDHALHELMKGAAVGLDQTGRHIAATLLKHWLENSGTPQAVDPATMMNDIPAFRNDVDAWLAHHQGQRTFDSGWLNEPALNNASNRTTGAEQDWYYALNDFRYRIVGTTSYAHGHPTTQYTVEVYKNWQFNPGRTPIRIPGLGTSISQDDLARLNTVGLSRDYVVSGTSYFGGDG